MGFVKSQASLRAPGLLDKVLVVRGDSEACVRRYTLPTRLIAVRFFQV